METKTVAATGHAHLVGSLKPKRFAIFSIIRAPQKRALVLKVQMIWQWKCNLGVCGKESCVDCASLIQTFCKQRRAHLAGELFQKLKCEGFLPDNTTLSAIMPCYAYSGLLPQAQAIWEEMLYSSFVPSAQIVYSLAISCFGKGGQLDLMEYTLKKMVSKGLQVDSATGNAFVMYYSSHGSLAEMEDS
ncbi:hypothetical protein OIU76_010180 [Salix suchowensis]|nr:hypothetical protein OIU76_010180 [Salix suchowensis]